MTHGGSIFEVKGGVRAEERLPKVGV